MTRDVRYGICCARTPCGREKERKREKKREKE
jgi:hypothetical protein